MSKLMNRKKGTELWETWISETRKQEEDNNNGGNNMETKSRYEVIADLEKQKRDLIRERDSFTDKVKGKENEIKLLKREVEDAEEDFKHFKETLDERKETIKELIAGIGDSLKRFSTLQTNSKK